MTESIVSDGVSNERETRSELTSIFRGACERLAAYAAEENIGIEPYRSPELVVFNSLPVVHAKAICDALVQYCETMTSIKEKGEYLKYNLNAFWLTLSKAGLRADNELFSKLESHDVIEIYTEQGLQIFRSFHFFQYCSYDLETLFCTPWFELFHGDAEHDQACAEVFAKFQIGGIVGTEKLPIKPHIVLEKAGRRIATRTIPRLGAALHEKSGSWRAFVHVFQAEPVSN